MKIIPLFLSFMLLGFMFAKGQVVYQATDSTDINFTIELFEKDSQFYLIPKLEIRKRGLKIKIPEKRIYVDGIATVAHSTSTIFFEKRISHTYTYITIGNNDDYVQSKKHSKFVDYEFGDILNDTINLQEKYPLEPGEYRASLEITYLNGNNEIVIQSVPFDFKILYIPKNAIF